MYCNYCACLCVYVWTCVSCHLSVCVYLCVNVHVDEFVRAHLFVYAYARVRSRYTVLLRAFILVTPLATFVVSVLFSSLDHTGTH